MLPHFDYYCVGVAYNATQQTIKTTKQNVTS